MKIKLGYGLLFFCTTAITFAQDGQNNAELVAYGITDRVFLTESIHPTNSQVQQDNFITISQIGDYNRSSVNVKSNNTQLSIIQNGTNNFVDIDKSANQIKESVFQSGNNNYIKDAAPYSNQNISQQFSQYGDNLNLYNYGSNSISDQMTVIQTGNQKSVIILSN